MLVVTQVRLTSPFLGELKPDSKGVRRFKLNDRRWIAVNQTGWLDDYVLAAMTLKQQVDVRKTVVPPAGIMPASVHLFRRTYSGACVEFFESLRKGAILTFEMLIRDDRPRSPSLDQLRALLAFQGEHCGISQWGKKFGFGRFELVDARDRYLPDPPPGPDAEPDRSRPQTTDHDETSAQNRDSI